MTGGNPRSGNGRFNRSVRTAERDAQAARLRADGWTYQRIANELGYASPGKAYEAVQKVLAATVAEPGAELRKLELERLNRMYVAAMEVLEHSHVTVSQGRVVKVNDVPVPDDAPVLAAIDRLLKIQERRAKLLGLDAPTRSEVITLDAVDAEIRRLEAEVGNAGRDEAGAPSVPA